MNNTIRIGFIDMLTAFLCSSAVLMIIIAYTRNESGNVAGTPRDYIYYKLIISDAPGVGEKDKGYYKKAKFRIMIETPDGKVLETSLSSDGINYAKSGFIELTSDPGINKNDFYAWGPTYEYTGNEGYSIKKHIVYNIYGTSPRDLGNANSAWKIGVLYYDHEGLEDNTYTNSDGIQLKNIVNAKLELRHYVQTMRDSGQYRTDVHNITLGQYSNIEL
jgi:hypothetical protein